MHSEQGLYMNKGFFGDMIYSYISFVLRSRSMDWFRLITCLDIAVIIIAESNTQNYFIFPLHSFYEASSTLHYVSTIVGYFGI